MYVYEQEIFMNKKFLSIILSFAVVFSVVFMNFDNLSVKVNAGLDPDIDLDIYNNSQYFYIKNVRSGKYLTLQNNSTSDGTLIVQWHYNGGNNQKWRFEYFGNTGTYGGEYQIVPYNNPGKAIQMVSATAVNGVEARLATKANDTKQFFRIEKNYTGSRRFVTNASNFTKVLEINGASVDDNAKLIHYSQVGNGSDQFLIEPVEYDEYFGCDYANHQYLFRIMTYPDFNKYYSNPSYQPAINQQMNFVSESVCASGLHYNVTNNPWYCNKNDFYQPSAFSQYDLNTHWDITIDWYMGSYFSYHWRNYCNSYSVYNYQSVYGNVAQNIDSAKGRIVMITTSVDGVPSVFWTGIIVDQESKKIKDYKVAFHLESLGNIYKLETICDILQNTYGKSSVNIYIIDP